MLFNTVIFSSTGHISCTIGAEKKERSDEDMNG